MLQERVGAAAVAEILALASYAAQRGWVPATSGNFSRRLDGRSAAVTRSGSDKGNLSPEDLIVVALDEPLPAGVSAETPLHVARYRGDPSIGAIAHVHSLPATVLSRVEAARGFIAFTGYELQKAFAGRDTHDETIRLPIFGNAQDTQLLAERIEAALLPGDAPGYLLAGHGLYAWGATAADARRHLEAFDFLLRCSLEERRLDR